MEFIEKVMARSPARPSRTCIRRARRVEFGGDPVRVGMSAYSTAIDLRLLHRACAIARDCTAHGHGTYVMSIVLGRARARRARKRHFSCTLGQVRLHACVSRTCTCTDVQWEIEEHENFNANGKWEGTPRNQTGETVQAMHGSFSFVSFRSVSQ